MSSLMRRFAVPMLIACATVPGQRAAAEPMDSPVPLAADAKSHAVGDALINQESAERALQMGFPTLANVIIEQLLAKPDLSADLRNKLVLDQVSALLDENRVGDAEQALKRYSGVPTPSSRLRDAMVAARNRRWDQVKTELGAFKPDDLPQIDRSWYFFLLGAMAYAANDPDHARGFFRQAQETAGSNVQRARFLLAESMVEIAYGRVSDAQIAAFRQTMETFAGSDTGRAPVSALAMALNARGDRGGAISVLQTQLQYLPRQYQPRHDEWQLYLALIAGPADGVGRNALRLLLTNGGDRDKQRVALQLLARGATDATRREEFRAKLDELISLPKQHPLLEELLLFRAQLELSDRKPDQTNVAKAEEDVTQLLQRFPGTQLKAYAYQILTDAAWERGQYRNAASNAAKSREQLPAGETRARLGLLAAEADFRGNDFVSASDAYRGVLDELPAGINPGDIMFQQLLSEIKAQRLDVAAKLLDDRSKDPRFDPMNRWQAEWNMTRALQADGRISDAYARLNRLLDTTSEVNPIPQELRARMRWLQARLSFDVGETQRTLALTGALLNDLQGVDATPRAEITSSTLLLQAQAQFTLSPDGPNEQAKAVLQRLRTDYRGSDAAVYSYIFEADAAARKGQLVDAQTQLTNLAESFPKSSYAPYALYQAAEYAERRGQETNYKEANRLLEKLVTEYSESDLVFYARLKQGHVMRRLSEYGLAEQAYESLENNPAFARHPGRAAAQLALADTHAAQGASDPAHLEKAFGIYERLLDLQTAPLALRIEAGYKYGLGLSLNGQPDKAMAIWGSVEKFLQDAKANPEAFGPQGRYWLGRCLLQFAELLKNQSKLDQAVEAYTLIVRAGLPGAADAQKVLNQLRPPAAG